MSVLYHDFISVELHFDVNLSISIVAVEVRSYCDNLVQFDLKEIKQSVVILFLGLHPLLCFMNTQ